MLAVDAAVNQKRRQSLLESGENIHKLTFNDIFGSWWSWPRRLIFPKTNWKACSIRWEKSEEHLFQQLILKANGIKSNIYKTRSPKCGNLAAKPFKICTRHFLCFCHSTPLHKDEDEAVTGFIFALTTAARRCPIDQSNMFLWSKQNLSVLKQNWPPGKKNCLSGRGAILITIKAILNFKSCKMKFSGVSSSLRLRRHATLSSLSLPSRLPTCAHPSHHNAHLHHNLLCTLVRNYKPPIHPLNSE